MKLKLAQRVVIGYYKTKLKTLALLSPKKAAEASFQLFCTPYSGKPKRKAPPIFHHAEKLKLEIEGLQVRGWHWKADHPIGKTILIAHGFDSCAYKFDRYVAPLKREGFNVVAFDAPGHGTSDGKILNARIYRDMILKIHRELFPLNGIMAHSLGGLATSLAVEQLDPSERPPIVLIAPAVNTVRALDNFFTFLPLGNQIRHEMELLIEQIGHQPVSYYATDRAVLSMSQPVLWIHDEQDDICPFEDVKNIYQQAPKHVDFVVTQGLGHSRIYRESKIKKQIVAFLKEKNM